jgi:WD40 repeat protein/tRNA A-37 threonylcarbamoyl transferase component Bud32
MDDLSPPPGDSPADPAHQLWQLWRQGRPPEVPEFLAAHPDLPLTRCVGVLRVDQQERWLRGQRVRAEDFLRHCPTLPEEYALDLVYSEFLLRERLGEAPDLAEYAGRFPQFAEQLRLQVELHRALERADAAPSFGAPSGEFADSPTVPQTHGSPDADAPLPQVPGHELLATLGRGGMGVVYKARQVKLKRLVALKVILARGHASAGGLTRFRTEAQAIARLQHPNIVQVYEVGEHDGLAFFSLELCAAGSLDRKLAGTPLPPRQAAALLEKLARAVHAAHEAGIVHRDLKPANVLLTADGTPKVTDFGLAKRLVDEPAAAPGLTATGEVMGTPSYMAPEQARGRIREQGPACDVYALGAVLYECLTGRPPFRAASPLETIRQVTDQEPVSPRALQPQVPRDLDTICRKCLEKDPRRRPGSARELAEELERFLQGRPIKARPLNRLGRLGRWCRRNPVLGAMGASVLLLLLALTAGSAVAAVWLNDARVAAEAAEQEKTEKLWQAYRDRARAERFSRQSGQRFASLAALAEAAGIRRDARLRDEAVACMALPDLRILEEGLPCPEHTAEVAFDAGLTRYACGDAQGNVVIRRLADGQVLQRLPGFGKDAQWLGFSPDGRFLAVGYAPGVEMQLFRIGHEQPLLHERAAARAWTFSPDGRVFWFRREADRLRCLDLRTCKERTPLPVPRAAHVMAMHRDGRQLAVGAGADVLVLDTWAKKLVAELPANASVDSIAWHPHGDRLTVGQYDGQLALWDLSGRRRLLTMEGHRQTVIDLAFHPDGELLASRSWDGTTRLWNAVTGQPVLVLPTDVKGLAFSFEGTRLGGMVRGRHLRWVEVAGGREYRTLDCRLGPRKGDYRAGDISPDGRLLAMAMEDGVRFWELASGRELACLPIESTCCALFLPDGRGLLTSGPDGLRHWPLRRDPGTADGWCLGPARKVPLPVSPARICLSPDGRTVAGASTSGRCGVVADVASGKVQGAPVPHARADHVALSPDGQWAATSGWHAGEVKIWKAATGKVVKELALGRLTLVYFTPDRKELITCRAEEYCFWEVGSWEPRRRLRREMLSYAGPLAFSSDGKLLAVELAAGKIDLLDAGTHRTLLRLEDPHHDPARWLKFTPDGASLVTNSGPGGVIHVWDLRRLQGQLAARGLPADLPGISPRPGVVAGGSLTLRLEQGNQGPSCGE